MLQNNDKIEHINRLCGNRDWKTLQCYVFVQVKLYGTLVLVPHHLLLTLICRVMRYYLLIITFTRSLLMFCVNIEKKTFSQYIWGSAVWNWTNSVGMAKHSKVFTHESSYCFQRVLAIAILSVRLSVHPSVTQVDQSKTVQARITKFSPLAVWKTLVSGTVKLFHKFEGCHPRIRGLNERRVGKICDFWPISRCISVTVRYRA